MEKVPQKIHFTDVAAINHFSSQDAVCSPHTVDITREMIASFADVTRNHQWIHEPHPYSRDDPYGGQIVHGLLLLSLIPYLLVDELFEIVGHNVRVIRGFEHVRFTYHLYPNERLYLSSKNLKAYSAPSGKGTIVERDINLWRDNIVWPETVAVCTIKLQYF
jgi:acyl dehydratase